MPTATPGTEIKCKREASPHRKSPVAQSPDINVSRMTTAPIPPAAQSAGASSSLADVDSSAVALMLENIALWPVLCMAAGRNRSFRSLFSEMTGLSKARIAQGNRNTPRESTLRKMRRNVVGWVAEQIGITYSEALDLVRAFEDSAARTKSGNFASWAGWVQAFEQPTVTLAISKAVALCADELIERLMANCLADDLGAFKQTWRDHLEYHGSAVRVGNEPPSMPAAPAQLDALGTISSWRDALSFSERALETLYFDVVAAVDAEWGSYYFAGRPHLPMCPLVMVRPQPGLVETGRAYSRRNVFYRPSRRLLELLYALLFYRRHRRWPTKAPGPQELARALDDPGAEDEKDAITETVISNHFDGTRKLTLALTREYWDRLQRHFSTPRAPKEPSAPPLPVIAFALYWEERLILDHGKSFLLPDLDAYEAHWAHRRRQWIAEYEGALEDQAQAGRATAEPIEWPAWMTDQSSASPL